MYIYVYLIIVLFLGIMILRINLFIIDSRLLIEWLVFRVNSIIIEILIVVD